MLKKKRLLALLLVGSLVPAVAVAADDADKGEPKKEQADEKKTKKDDAKKDEAGGFMSSVNSGFKSFADLINTPLRKLAKQVTEGSKTAFVATVGLAYTAWKALPGMFEDGKQLVHTAKRCVAGGEDADWDADEE